MSDQSGAGFPAIGGGARSVPRTNTYKQSSSRAMPKPTPEQVQEDKEKGPLEAGQRVKARYLNTRNQWSHHLCQGVVRCINKDGTVAIDYDDNEKAEQVPRNYVHRLDRGGAGTAAVAAQSNLERAAAENAGAASRVDAGGGRSSTRIAGSALLRR